MITPARALALEAFDAVLSERRFLDDALAQRAGAFQKLEPRDRGFLRTLLLTAFRRLGEIDAGLDAVLERDPPPRARRVLQLALAEILFLDTPAYAAVDAGVEAMKRAEPRLGGLANAVLRRLAREAGPLDAPDAIARANTPDWLMAALTADWGADHALAIAAGQLAPAPLDVTPAAPRKAEALASALSGDLTPSGSIRARAKGDPAALPGYADGAWWVQDAAAALPARMLAAAPDEPVLDLCAAPGGKTLQLAAAGARVTAVDISEWRLRRVADNLGRTGLSAEVLHADALSWRPERPFPAVLLDAPCSATGTIRRHPEALRIKGLAGLKDLMSLQDRLLDAAWAMTAPGGRLVFCTCSLFKAEGEDRLAAFLERHGDARLAPIGDPALAPFAAESGALRTSPADWADIGGLDGFFAARIDKADG